MSVEPSGNDEQFANWKLAIESSLMYPLSMVIFQFVILG